MVPPQPGISLKEAIDSVPDLKDLYRNDDEIRRLLDLSLSLEGMARHASTHAAGLVITPTPLVNHVPLFRSNKGEITTQYEMKILNSIGLLKIDILGLKTLSHISNTLKLVAESEGTEIRAEDIPIEDEQAFKLLQRGETVGIFQLESEGMRNLLRRIKPTAFQDVLAINALYRPGPLRSGLVDDFIECKHGRKKITYMDPRLKPVLEETYGVILYQEQVMRIASDLAGFSLGEADILRRAMGKKDKKTMSRMRAQFIEGAAERDLSRKKAEKIFDLMSGFAEYGFNKSHSAAYAMVSMQTAFLKANYPAAFMAAAMTNDMGKTDRLMFLLEECHSLGIPVRPPDVNSSGIEFGLSGGEITYGLAAIKNIGIPAAEAIVEARSDGPFLDLYDLCERVNSGSVNRRALESLIKSGATDSLPGTRSQKIASLNDAVMQAQKLQNERDTGQKRFIFDEGPSGFDSSSLKEVPPWDEDKKLREEKESLGFYFSGHPLDRYKNVLGSIVNTGSVSLSKRKQGRNVIIAGLINGVRVIQDRRGNSMAFVSMEDFYGSFEAIVFASCYRKARKELVEENAVVIRGKISNRDRGETKIIADNVYSVDRALGALARRVILTLHSNSFSEKSLASLKDIMARYPGRRELFFNWRENGSELFSIKSGKVSVEPSIEFVERIGKIDGVENVEVSV
jgi:DNA polymerase-3 subunit alpha